MEWLRTISRKQLRRHERYRCILIELILQRRMGAGHDIELRADEERDLVACGVVSGSQPWGIVRIETRVIPVTSG